MRRGIGAVVGYAGETPVEADWRVVKIGDGKFTGTGPFYGGAKFQIGPMALVTDEASGVSAVLASKRIQAADQEMFRHVGVEPVERADPRAEIDGAFPRRLPAHRRDDPGRAVARRAHHRSRRDALQAPPQRHQAQADGAGVERSHGTARAAERPHHRHVEQRHGADAGERGSRGRSRRPERRTGRGLPRRRSSRRCRRRRRRACGAQRVTNSGMVP